ncbi:hypothetical protein BHE74_00046638 [Ensete ventricosum]|nr:hypothetical protein BHE74_00046638 [Ensete ventricosum]RZR94938.1 hypothetical protein BHM03_00023716 [Ensete ventricosum]
MRSKYRKKEQIFPLTLSAYPVGPMRSDETRRINNCRVEKRVVEKKIKNYEKAALDWSLIEKSARRWVRVRRMFPGNTSSGGRGRRQETMWYVDRPVYRNLTLDATC